MDRETASWEALAGSGTRVVGNRDAAAAYTRANTLLRSRYPHHGVPSRYATSRFLVCHHKIQ